MIDRSDRCERCGERVGTAGVFHLGIVSMTVEDETNLFRGGELWLCKGCERDFWDWLTGKGVGDAD